MTEIGGVEADVTVNGMPVEEERPIEEPEPPTIAEILAPEPPREQAKPDGWQPDWMPPGLRAPEPQEFEPAASADDALPYYEQPIDRLLKPEEPDYVMEATGVSTLGAQAILARTLGDERAHELLSDPAFYQRFEELPHYRGEEGLQRAALEIAREDDRDKRLAALEAQREEEATYGPESRIASELAELKRIVAEQREEREQIDRVVAEQDAALRQAQSIHKYGMEALIETSKRFGHTAPTEEQRQRMGEWVIDNGLLGANPNLVARWAYQEVMKRDPLQHYDRRRAEVVIPGKVFSIPSAPSGRQERSIDDVAAAADEWPHGQLWRMAE